MCNVIASVVCKRINLSDIYRRLCGFLNGYYCKLDLKYVEKNRKENIIGNGKIHSEMQFSTGMKIWALLLSGKGNYKQS